MAQLGAQAAVPVAPNTKIGQLDMINFMDQINSSFGLLMIAGAALPDLHGFIEQAKFKSVNLEKCTFKFLSAIAAKYPADGGSVVLKAIIVAVCFGINMTRGDRMADDIKTFVSNLQSDTGIKKGTGVEKEDQMTWQRLLLAFPYARGVFQELGIVQPIGTVPPGLSPFYAQQGGPSMCSNQIWEDENFQSLFKKWMVSNSKQLNRRNKNAKKKNDEIEEDQMGYAAVQQSNPFSEKARMGWWNGAAMLRVVLLLNKAVGITLAAFKAMLKERTVIPPELFDGASTQALWADANQNALDNGVIAALPNVQ